MRFVRIAPLLLIAALGIAVGLRVWGLMREQADDAGARLHLRFVTLFSAVAVVPAVLVALVFGVLVNRGVEGWFSSNVRAAVENSAEIGGSFVRDVSEELETDLSAMRDELSRPEVMATFSTPRPTIRSTC